MSSGKILLGVVVGAAAAAVLGRLVAPARSSVMRKRMARKVTDNDEDIQENLTEHVDGTAEEYDIIGRMLWI